MPHRTFNFVSQTTLMTHTRLASVFLVALALLILPKAGLCLEVPVVEVETGHNAPHLAEFVRYAKNYTAAINYDAINAHAPPLKSVNGESIQFGRASSNLLILIRVKNVGVSAGNWVFSTDRGSATTLQIYHLTPESTTLRFDSDEFPAAKQTLQTFQHYADPLNLESQEEVIIAVYSSVEDSAYFPLVLQDRDKFLQSSNLTMMLAAGCTAAILALLLLNLFFYLSTGRREFVWLVAAEFFLATVVMYLVGFLSTYVFYATPMWGLIFGDVTKYGYVACMAQFARVFVDTPNKLPKNDLFLRGLIAFSVAMIVVQLLSPLIPTQVRISLHAFNYLTIAVTAFYFTYIGVYATRKLGSENWPLIVAWGSIAAFGIYAACAYSGAIPNLPMNFYVIAPVGTIEATFATLAIGLNLRKSQQEYHSTKEKYLESLQEKLEISEAAQRLAEEKSAAMATIVDQSALLHASGHDSKQVLLALNSVLDAVQTSDSLSQNPAIAGILESSASYLDKIVATTMSGARIGSSDSESVALTALFADELVLPLEMMYRQLFQRKGITLNVTQNDEVKLITDRALVTRALSNLLSNSLKFTDQGDVTVSTARSGDSLVLTIIDDGVGISDLLAEKLNQTSHQRVRENPTREGTGSGFRYAQQVIAHLGGSTRIEPDRHGTRVTVRLPCEKQFTGCQLSQLQERLPSTHWHDIDQDSLADNSDTIDSDPKPRIAVTFDDSTATRQRLSSGYDVIIYKPLKLEYAAYLEQYVFSQDRTN